MPEHSHQLAAILFADIVNYTAMMQEDENTALEKITRFRHVIDIIVEELEGRSFSITAMDVLFFSTAQRTLWSSLNFYRQILMKSQKCLYVLAFTWVMC
jgi:class 3 adenylate cyclase